MTQQTQIQINWKQRLFYFFPVLFAFYLPFGHDLIPDVQVLSGLVVLWGLSSFLNLNSNDQKRGWTKRNLWLPLSFFILTCISAFISINKKEAAFSVENKLAFLIIPYLFFCFQWQLEIIKKCLVAFVSGCFFASLILIARAFYYAMNGHTEYFFYTNFSYFIHAAYFAMYLLLAISIIFLYYKVWFKNQGRLLYTSWFFIALFTITIFLCASKIGIICFFVLIPWLVFYKWRSFFTLKRSLIFFAGLIALTFLAFKIFPGVFERLSSIASVSGSQIDKTSSESTAVRLLIWEQCLSIIRQNFFFGTGVGDANDALYKAYSENGLSGALSHHFNAHNQYFQTFIGLGIIGFLLLLFLTIGQMIKAFIKKNIILLVFSFLIVVNFLVESMLQTSAGTLFFVFFFCIFNLSPHEELQK